MSLMAELCSNGQELALAAKYPSPVQDWTRQKEWLCEREISGRCRRHRPVHDADLEQNREHGTEPLEPMFQWTRRRRTVRALREALRGRTTLE